MFVMYFVRCMTCLHSLKFIVSMISWVHLTWLGHFECEWRGILDAIIPYAMLEHCMLAWSSCIDCMSNSFAYEPVVIWPIIKTRIVKDATQQCIYVWEQCNYGREMHLGQNFWSLGVGNWCNYIYIPWSCFFIALTLNWHLCTSNHSHISICAYQQNMCWEHSYKSEEL